MLSNGTWIKMKAKHWPQAVSSSLVILMSSFNGVEYKEKRRLTTYNSARDFCCAAEQGGWWDRCTGMWFHWRY